MLNTVFLILQILLLIACVTILLQFRRFLKRADTLDDEPLRESDIRFLKVRATLLCICIGASILIEIAQFILKMID